MGMIEREFKLKVERARNKNLDALVEINQAAAPKWHRTKLLKAALSEKRAFIAFMGRIPAGFLIWTKDFYSHHFIDLVIVHPEMRRKGVAQAMLKAMEAICPGNKLFSSTNRSNKAMQKVFQGAGYVKSGFISHLDKGNPEWIYYKKVAPRAEVIHRKNKSKAKKRKR
jgi:ribosomal protein S18 acetylase RimI-like enzyme